MGKIEIYQDKKDEWRFRIIAGNGEIVGVSSEGYKKSGGAVNGIESIKENINSEIMFVEKK